MDSVHPPVLIVGTGPVGLVAVLTLLQNSISVRIIDKDPHPRIGQCGAGIWLQSLELYNELLIGDAEGEQFANTFLSTKTKIAITKALDAFGVKYIELTSPTASEQSCADCEAICKLGLKTKIHLHNDTRMAIANASCALEAGATLGTCQEYHTRQSATFGRASQYSYEPLRDPLNPRALANTTRNLDGLPDSYTTVTSHSRSRPCAPLDTLNISAATCLALLTVIQS
ncbi:hypothetical protein EDD22DRAFT_1006019 [Suillus occidentalis]|nr:hypothetical protein EDD22DRAFT_1006019 [Suillus occidentalis]